MFIFADIVDRVNSEDIINVTELDEKVFVPKKEIRIILRDVLHDYPNLSLNNTVFLTEESISDIISLDGRSDYSFTLNLTTSSTTPSPSDSSIKKLRYSSRSSSTSSSSSTSDTEALSSTSSDSIERVRYKCTTVKRKKMLTRSRARVINSSDANEKPLPILRLQKRGPVHRKSKSKNDTIKPVFLKRNNRLSLSCGSAIDLSVDSSSDDFVKNYVSTAKPSVSKSSDSSQKETASFKNVQPITKQVNPVNNKNLDETVSKIKEKSKQLSSPDDQTPAFNIKLDVVSNKGRGCKAACCSKIIMHPPTPITDNKNKQGKMTQLIEPLQKPRAKRSRSIQSYPGPSDFEDLLTDNILSLPDLMDTQLQLPINNLDTSKQIVINTPIKTCKVKALSTFDSQNEIKQQSVKPATPEPKPKTIRKRRPPVPKEPQIKRGRRPSKKNDTVCKIPLTKIHKVPNVIRMKINVPQQTPKNLPRIPKKKPVVEVAQEPAPTVPCKTIISSTTESLLNGFAEPLKASNQLVDNIGSNTIDSFESWLDENFNTDNGYEETINSIKDDLVRDTNLNNVQQLIPELENVSDLPYPMSSVEQLIPNIDLQTPCIPISTTNVAPTPTHNVMHQEMSPYMSDDYSILDLSSKPYSTCIIRNRMDYVQPETLSSNDEFVLDLSMKSRPITTFNSSYMGEHQQQQLHQQQQPFEIFPSTTPLDLTKPKFLPRSQSAYIETTAMNSKNSPFYARATSNDLFDRSTSSIIDLSNYKKKIFSNNNTIVITKPVTPVEQFQPQNFSVSNNVYPPVNRVTSTNYATPSSIINSHPVMTNHRSNNVPINYINNYNHVTKNGSDMMINNCNNVTNQPAPSNNNPVVNNDTLNSINNKLVSMGNISVSVNNTMPMNINCTNSTRTVDCHVNQDDDGGRGRESENDSDEISLFATSPMSLTSNQGNQENDISAIVLDTNHSTLPMTIVPSSTGETTRPVDMDLEKKE